MQPQTKTLLCHLLMKLPDGSIAEDSKTHNKPIKFVIGNNSLTPKLEEHLQDATTGDIKNFHLEPEDLYGHKNEKNVLNIEKHKFNDDVNTDKGSIVEFKHPSNQIMIGTIIDKNEKYIKVDFNHPLAGYKVDFEIEVLEVMN